MTNRLRTEIQEEEKEIIVDEKPVKEFSNTFLAKFLSKSITAERATSALPFILYVALLGMIYIGNMHLAEKNIRDLDKVSKEVKELSWDYKTTKADLAYKSTLTEVAKRVDTLGIKESLQPPQKIKEAQDEH